MKRFAIVCYSMGVFAGITITLFSHPLLFNTITFILAIAILVSGFKLVDQIEKKSKEAKKNG